MRKDERKLEKGDRQTDRYRDRQIDRENKIKENQISKANRKRPGKVARKTWLQFYSLNSANIYIYKKVVLQKTVHCIVEQEYTDCITLTCVLQSRNILTVQPVPGYC